MSNGKCLHHDDAFRLGSVCYQFKEGLPCSDCCFCKEDPDGDFLCEVPFGVPYCQDGGFVVCSPDKRRHYVELTDDQLLTVITALEYYRHSVTDFGLRELSTSCLTVFENV